MALRLNTLLSAPVVALSPSPSALQPRYSKCCRWKVWATEHPTIFLGAVRPRKSHSSPPTWVKGLVSAQVLTWGSRNPREFLSDTHTRSISGSDEGAVGGSWVGAGPHKAQAMMKPGVSSPAPILSRRKRTRDGVLTGHADMREHHKILKIRGSGSFPVGEHIHMQGE